LIILYCLEHILSLAKDGRPENRTPCSNAWNYMGGFANLLLRQQGDGSDETEIYCFNNDHTAVAN
jgi:hypothetical protein